jgi:hypothetical protein
MKLPKGIQMMEFIGIKVSCKVLGANIEIIGNQSPMNVFTIEVTRRVRDAE